MAEVNSTYTQYTELEHWNELTLCPLVHKARHQGRLTYTQQIQPRFLFLFIF